MAELTSSSAGIEARLKTSENSLNDAQKRINELEIRTSDQSSKIEIYQEKQRTYETERRKLHNTILELKGNIRVFCRVRPMSSEEEANRRNCNSKSNEGHVPHIVFTGEKSLEIVRSAGKEIKPSSFGYCAIIVKQVKNAVLKTLYEICLTLLR